MTLQFKFPVAFQCPNALFDNPNLNNNGQVTDEVPVYAPKLFNAQRKGRGLA